MSTSRLLRATSRFRDSRDPGSAVADSGSAGRNGLGFVGVAAVQAWRYTLGLLTPAGTCKYHPSCSQYALDAFREFGLVRGTILTGWRLLRCNPWSHGGVDYAHDQTLFRRRRGT